MVTFSKCKSSDCLVASLTKCFSANWNEKISSFMGGGGGGGGGGGNIFKTF